MKDDVKSMIAAMCAAGSRQSKQEREKMNFSYEFEGHPAEFQADSFCDDTVGGWEGFDYGEKP